MEKRKLIFIRNVIYFTCSTFGGAQAHLPLLLKYFVQRNSFISEEELLELNALSQFLPGPASTQTLAGIAYKVGGLKLAILSFLIWVLPGAILMTVAAINLKNLGGKERFEAILSIINPIALGIVAYGAFSLARKTLTNRLAVYLAGFAVITTLLLREAYVFPIAILIGGMISSAMQTPLAEAELRFKLLANINKNKLMYFIGVLFMFALVGGIINRTSPFSLPIRLFENFYRNGILVFGGGQVLVPLMFTEFVQVKHYVQSGEFLSGFALQQAIPGPTFSFASYLGALSMKNFNYGLGGQIIGGIIGVLGINLPGLILVLFIVPFWNDLKKINQIKNSLTGIIAVSVGFIFAALILMAIPLGFTLMSVGLMTLSFVLLLFTKINPAFLVLGGVLLGYFI